MRPLLPRIRENCQRSSLVVTRAVGRQSRPLTRPSAFASEDCAEPAVGVLDAAVLDVEQRLPQRRRGLPRLPRADAVDAVAQCAARRSG